MIREDLRSSLVKVLLGGPDLPWLATLRRTASSYAPFLQEGTTPIPLFVLTGLVLWLLWKKGPGKPADLDPRVSS